jgi:hypothetical protein
MERESKGRAREERRQMSSRGEGRGKRLEADAGVRLAALGNLMGYVGC